MRASSLAALPLLLLPLCVRAQTGATVEVTGRVLDAATNAPVARAVVELRDVSRKVLSDTAGRFVLRGIAPGTHQWVITRLGYASWDESTEVAEGDEFTVGLLPRPEMLEGITVVTSQLETRRRASGLMVRTVDHDALRLSAAPSMLEVVGDYLGVRGRPCGPDGQTSPRPGPEIVPGEAQPGAGAGPERKCAIVRGELIEPDVYVDERRATNSLADLENYLPENIYTVESYRGGDMIRVITVGFAEQLARGRVVLLPLSFYH
jgi:hypothetical protein